MKPDFSEEKSYWAKGLNFVVGIDEAGRGPLAGPVVAGAVLVRANTELDIVVNDSKKISEKRREELYEILTKHPDITWGVGVVSEEVIDKINILQATKIAMKKALEALPKEVILIDGNFKIEETCQQKSIIKGDQKVFSIAAASIIAKVTRDRLMKEVHEKYPEYGFGKHKGYGTALHIANLKTYGALPVHRKTFCQKFLS